MALLLVAPPPVAGQAWLHPSAVSATVDSLAAAELRFFQQWGAAWRVSEASRHAVELVNPPRLAAWDLRGLLTICYFHIPADKGRYELAIGGRGIAGRSGPRNVCPSWFAGDGDPPFDEWRSGIDAALIDRLRQPLRDARADLMTSFQRASGRLPSNDWILGQAVRLAVDERAFEQAAALLEPCRATRWWCFALRGYAEASADRTVDANRAFAAALEAMPAETRCRWSDNALLLDSAGRRAYSNLSCAARDTVNERLWWLSDPLFALSGNERLSEQLRRLMTIRLHQSLVRDERYDWRPVAGGDPRSELVMRYGWPTLVYWVGYAFDVNGDTYSGSRGGPFDDPQTTYEYARTRVHLIPSWRAVLDPLAARAEDWSLNDPTARPNDAGGANQAVVRFHGVRQRPEDSVKIAHMGWWPVEHAALPYTLEQLQDGQIAFFRRDNRVLLASAVRVPDELLHASGRVPATAALVTSSRPDASTIVTEGTRGTDGRVELHGLIEAVPALAGIEILPGQGHGAARNRRSIVPPPPLTALKPGDIAISDPALLDVQSESRDLTPQADSALKLLAPSLHIHGSQTVGVYWETYGFSPLDSVQISVWVERYTPQGIARRLEIALNLVRDLNTPVVVQWDESGLGPQARLTEGRVPIIARVVTLDVSHLPTGDYWLDVAVGRQGQEPVRGRRTFSVD